VGPYREVVTFVVLGIAIMLLYAGVAAWMAVVARRDPARIFQIGRYGRIKRRDVTASEWIRRYVPWGLGGGLLITLLGLFVTSRAG
jgi:hypothetical protein